MKLFRIVQLISTAVMVASVATAQSQKVADIDAVIKGKVSGNQYTNEYFGVVVPIPEPNTYVQTNPLIRKNRAKLLEVINDTSANRYIFDVVTEASDDMSATSYARALRRGLEE